MLEVWNWNGNRRELLYEDVILMEYLSFGMGEKRYRYMDVEVKCGLGSGAPIFTPQFQGPRILAALA